MAAARADRAASPAELRERLGRARLMLIFTPDLVPAGEDPLEVLDAVVPAVDAVQVRIKPLGAGNEPSSARELFEWTERVLSRVERWAHVPLVLANDRVDVALALAPRGCAGVHLGQDDCPPDEARRVLGPGPLVGLSTHDARQLGEAQREAVDYLGFGPVFGTATKGYGRGLGPEAAWVAHAASSRPVFPIGGIQLANASELAPVGRAAVGAAILAAEEPGRAARELRALLEGPDEPRRLPP